MKKTILLIVAMLFTIMAISQNGTTNSGDPCNCDKAKTRMPASYEAVVIKTRMPAPCSIKRKDMTAYTAYVFKVGTYTNPINSSKEIEAVKSGGKWHYYTTKKYTYNEAKNIKGTIKKVFCDAFIQQVPNTVIFRDH